MRIANPSGSTIDAVRIYLSGVPVGVVVANQVGVAGDGRPYVVHNFPLVSGGVVEVVIEYFVPSVGLIPTAVVFHPEVILPFADPRPNLIGSTLTGLTVTRRQSDSRYVLDFLSLTGRTYYVQYSDDGGTTWTTVLAPLTGNGTRVVWLDQGAPKTVTDPSTVAARNYRVILMP